MLNALVFEHAAVGSALGAEARTVPGEAHLYSLWMKAVWTTLGC